MARRLACRPDFWLASAQAQQSNFGRSHPLPCFAHGACTSAFRLIDALLLRPLPVAHPERLYVLSRQGTGFDNKPGEWDSWAYPDFQLMRAAAKGQAELVAISYADRADVTYKTAAETEKATLQYASGWMFSTFVIQPALGASVH